METGVIPIAEETEEMSGWNEAPLPRFEEELDILAFELWHRGSLPDVELEEDWSAAEDCVGSHASCL